MSFTELIWEWDYYRDFEKLRVLYFLGESLTFLGSEVVIQEKSICGCPFCEVWYEQCNGVLKFIEILEDVCSVDLLDTLRSISAAFDNLTQAEIECYNFDIFKLKGWDVIRNLSKLALVQLEWDLLKIYADDLEANL